MLNFRLILTLALLTASPASTVAQSPPKLQDAIARIQSQDFEGAVGILRKITQQQEQNAFAWMLLGSALHSKGDYEAAIPIHLKATEFPQVAPRAFYNLAKTYARLGETEKAFEWLRKATDSKRVDVTQYLIDPDLNGLREEPRFQEFLLQPRDFANPFVEEARILKEWRGEESGGAFGWIARNIGDVDGDGVNDVTTSAPNLNIEGANAGRIYVYSSRSGKLLWTQSGQPGDNLGSGIEAAGDVNADGIPDVAAGAPGAGKAYVYSGRDGKVLLTLKEEGKADSFGRKVSDLGDFDGDGHDDVLVGAPNHDSAGKDAGAAYLYSGKDGSLLLKLEGEGAGDNFGSSAGGWVDGERMLLVIGAPNAAEGQRGRVYVYGDRSGKPKFVIDSDEKGAQLGGMFVSVVGDVDADGFPDVYASDWSHNANGPQTGRIYVHSGRTGTRLMTLTGEAPGDGFGIGVADAGDLDADGHDDLVIGAWRQSSAAFAGGKVYLYSGKDGSLLRSLTCKVPGDTFGFDATGMGDVDGDGTIDLLLTSAWSAVNGYRSGRMFIVSGKWRP